MDVALVGLPPLLGCGRPSAAPPLGKPQGDEGLSPVLGNGPVLGLGGIGPRWDFPAFPNVSRLCGSAQVAQVLLGVTAKQGTESQLYFCRGLFSLWPVTRGERQDSE